MMILITPQDWARLSEDARAEILALMGSRNELPPSLVDTQGLGGLGLDLDEHEKLFSEAPSPTYPVTTLDSSSRNKGKVVIEIDETQVKEMILNLSEKSIGVLKLFSDGSPVSIAQLIGKDKPYSDYTELKRSFVGPVNRRLRTVTKNRSAVLFLKTEEDDGDIAMAVKTPTAIALKKVFQL